MRNEMTDDWQVYHMFLAMIDGQSYRCSAVLDEAAFDRRMDVLHWKMPYNLRAFHSSDPVWVVENPVLKAYPELPEAIDRILNAIPLQTMRLKDKRRQETLPVRWKHGDYVIVDTEDGYGRFGGSYHAPGGQRVHRQSSPAQCRPEVS